jgi:maltooligosyltrehalose trehalohydrolase
MSRRLPIGAETQRDGLTHFRVWAPDPGEVMVIVEPRTGPVRALPLVPEPHGYYSALVPEIGVGDRYRFRLDGVAAPDPASRFQPEGPFGPSEIVDPARFQWTDRAWNGVTIAGQIIYELHIGTFTPAGTWRAAIERLPHLADTGITLLEVMPIAEMPGGFGWGYDGVFPFAPVRTYGTPDDARAFVDRAHALGLGVILDVVLNHLGPEGCVHRAYARAYFARNRANEWGDSLNFDGPDSGPVREYFAANAAYWIDEYHFDGLRLDATQSMLDTSDTHVVAMIASRARVAAGHRSIIVLAENERQEAKHVRSIADGGYGLDAVWNDDFHHSAVVALTGRREAYYSDHRGTPQELISAAKHGYLFQGQRYSWQGHARGTRTDGLRPQAFVNFIENHDQLANTGDGARLWTHTAPGLYRAMTALLLLMPGTPMLFQGQEFGSSAPFLYFADHEPTLAAAVLKGRSEFVRQFRSLATAEMQAHLPVPHERSTFERCKIDWTELASHQAHHKLHTDLIALRKGDAAFAAQDPVDGAVVTADAFVLRYQAAQPADERILIVNLGQDIEAGSFAEPLVAPPEGFAWQIGWSSEHPDYGGLGVADVVSEHGWKIPGHSATVLKPGDTYGGD